MDAQTVTDRRVDYEPLSQIRAAPRNAKRHDAAGIGSSISEFGFAELPLIDERTGRLVAGHGRIEDLIAKRQAGHEPPDGVRADPETGEWYVPVVRGWASRDDAHAEAYVLASNKLVINGGWDDATLAEALAAMAEDDLLALTGFTDADLAGLLDDGQPGAGPGDGLTDPDALPAPPLTPKSQTGDVWLLGPHRVMCGDSTSPRDVARLVDGLELGLIHADPPYGMGKESEGVANDNLYREKLDEFQMAWWAAWAPVLAANGSAYIWGTAPDLWRLWWTRLHTWTTTDRLELMVRNEIVWDKTTGQGMRSAERHSYPIATERCLFLMRGEQFLGNLNTEDFPEVYEPLRAWLAAERDKAGWGNADVNRLTGTHMAGHWFTRAQFMPISAQHYATLQGAAAGRAFTVAYDDLFAQLFPGVRAGGNEHKRELAEQLRERRSYFDNTHDAMTDVWDFPRVLGEDRYGHATPKPVAMVERVFHTSSTPGSVVGVPFGGSGPELIAAHRTGRVVVAMELQPSYVDVICRRYQEHTGTMPVNADTGDPMDFTR